MGFKGENFFEEEIKDVEIEFNKVMFQRKVVVNGFCFKEEIFYWLEKRK